jgi:hypothetical protein
LLRLCLRLLGCIRFGTGILCRLLRSRHHFLFGMERFFQCRGTTTTAVFVECEAGTSWNEPSDDDVLLESAQTVAAAAYGCFCQYSRCFLYGCALNKRLGDQ